MPSALLCHALAMLYCVQLPQTMLEELPTSALHDAYEYFLGQTGHARTALARMASLNKALLRHRAKHPRLDLWCRFLGLTATTERYPCMLLHAYINSLEYVRSLQRDFVQVPTPDKHRGTHRFISRGTSRVCLDDSTICRSR